VHRSTLVTAGIWVLIRFFSNSSSTLWLLLGSLTTLTASFAALLETDMKKIVALSTLSQLGLIIVSLFLGGKLICLFHLVCHAFAKADLFLIVGRILGLNYSQQDSRKLPISTNTLRLALAIRVVRLRGTLFQSGIYSKEQILLTHYTLYNRVFS
jgi:NADH:ubiquinone oxidoreductase subunit 5 (subunit L)/multisubunit Na+/H+ antiporter MnhA subunit